MNDDEVGCVPEHRGGPCPFAWCTTRHGETTHEADEDHRSDGRAVAVTHRDGRGDDAESTVEVEIGLLRRRDDTRAWLVIEDGRDIRVQVAVETVRDLLRAVLADPAVADELGIPGVEER